MTFSPWILNPIVGLALLTAQAPTPISERLAFIQMNPQSRSFQLVTLDSERQITPLTDAESSAVYPALAPGGNWLAYSLKRKQDSFHSLHLYDFARKQDRLLLAGREGDVLQAAFSSDGKRLAVSGPFGPNLQPRIGIMNLGEGELDPEIETIPSDGDAYYPAFDPQGETLFFTEQSPSDTSHQMQVVSYNLESRERQAISATGILAKAPTVSPDGHYLAYLVPEANGKGVPANIYLLDRLSGETLIVTSQAKTRYYRPTFRADGSLLYSKAPFEKPYQLMTISAASIAARQFAETVFLENALDTSHIMVAISPPGGETK